MFIKNVTSKYFFQQKKYLPIGNLIEHDSADYIAKKYATEALKNPENNFNDSQCPKSNYWYGAPECEYLLLNTLPRLEYVTGLDLEPTYSYMRVYKDGEELKRHIDRAACEITVSITLGKGSDYDWPIWIQDPKDITNETPIDIPMYHGLLFRGQEIKHWRNKFTPEDRDDWQCQLFLHYVDAHGPCAKEKYDKREGFKITPCGENKDYKMLDIPYEVI